MVMELQTTFEKFQFGRQLFVSKSIKTWHFMIEKSGSCITFESPAFGPHPVPHTL